MSGQIGENGRNLIFLISQPRAGSTLLQRIIGGHPAVHTSQEPTFMLHPLYALRESGIEAEYQAEGARLFTAEFLKTLPGGRADYDEALRRMAGYLYGQALAGRAERYFLDKTPRYYFIIPDLARLFPEAKFIILLRQPLAVLNSIWRTWIKDHWFMVHGVRHDLLTAPGRLLAGLAVLGERRWMVRYESLVSEPEVVLRPLFEWLGLEFEAGLVEYGRQTGLPRWELADQKRVYSEARPVRDSLDSWRASLAAPQFWRLASDYRLKLGTAVWQGLGYDTAEVDEILAANKPAGWRLAGTVSMDWLMATAPDDRSRIERARLKLARLANGGAGGAESATN